jgi:hypothetical protein
MSHSYRHSFILQQGRGGRHSNSARIEKRLANRSVRRTPVEDESPLINHSGYKKLYPQYDVCEYKSYQPTHDQCHDGSSIDRTIFFYMKVNSKPTAREGDGRPVPHYNRKYNQASQWNFRRGHALVRAIKEQSFSIEG